MIDTLAGVGAALSLFLLLVLSAKRPLQAPDLWLAIWLAAQGLLCVALLVSVNARHAIAFGVLILGQFTLLILGPAQYLYAATMLKAQRRYGVHAAVVAVGGVVILALPLSADACAKGGVIGIYKAAPWLLAASFGIQAVLSLYPLAVLRLVNASTRDFKCRLSRVSAVDPGWVRLWAWSSFGLLSCWALLSANAVTMRWPAGVQVTVSLSLLIAHVVFVGRRGLTNPGIFTSGSSSQPRAPAAKDPIDPIQVVEDHGRVQALLARDKPYLDPELTASDLAYKLGWGSERLTRALRDGGGVNFFDAVNAARVGEVQRLARGPEGAGRPLMDIARQAGFGSKSALYEAFQRHAGCTPAAWRRRELLPPTR